MAEYPTDLEEERRKKIEFARKRLEKYRETAKRGPDMGVHDAQNPKGMQSFRPSAGQYGQAPDKSWTMADTPDPGRPNSEIANGGLGRYQSYHQDQRMSPLPSGGMTQQMNYPAHPTQPPRDFGPASNPQKIYGKLGDFFSKFLSGGNPGTSVLPDASLSPAPPQHPAYPNNYGPMNVAPQQPPTAYGGQIPHQVGSPTFQQWGQTTSPRPGYGTYQHDTRKDNPILPQAQVSQSDVGFAHSFGTDPQHLPPRSSGYQSTHPQDADLRRLHPNSYGEWQPQAQNPQAPPGFNPHSVPLGQSDTHVPQIHERPPAPPPMSKIEPNYPGFQQNQDGISYPPPKHTDPPQIHTMQAVQTPEKAWKMPSHTADEMEFSKPDNVPVQQHVQPPKPQNTTFDFQQQLPVSAAQENGSPFNFYKPHNTRDEQFSFERPPEPGPEASQPPLSANYSHMSYSLPKDTKEHNDVPDSSHDFSQVSLPTVTQTQPPYNFFDRSNTATEPQHVSAMNDNTMANNVMAASNIMTSNAMVDNNTSGYDGYHGPDNYNAGPHVEFDDKNNRVIAPPEPSMTMGHYTNKESLHHNLSPVQMFPNNPEIPDSVEQKHDPDYLGSNYQHSDISHPDDSQKNIPQYKYYLDILSKVDNLEKMMEKLVLHNESRGPPALHPVRSGDSSLTHEGGDGFPASSNAQYPQDAIPASKMQKLLQLEKEVESIHLSVTGERLGLLDSAINDAEASNKLKTVHESNNDADGMNAAVNSVPATASSKESSDVNYSPYMYTLNLKKIEMLLELVINLYKRETSQLPKEFEQAPEFRAFPKIRSPNTPFAQNPPIVTNQKFVHLSRTEDTDKHDYPNQDHTFDNLDDAYQAYPARTPAYGKERDSTVPLDDKAYNKLDVFDEPNDLKVSAPTVEHQDVEFRPSVPHKGDAPNLQRLYSNTNPDSLLNRKMDIKMKLDEIKKGLEYCKTSRDGDDPVIDSINSGVKPFDNINSEGSSRRFS